MIKFVEKVLLWITAIALYDLLFGLIWGRCLAESKGGDTYKEEYIANHMTDSLLVFGSSKAVHHYNPEILEDSLSISCFNCGYDGMGIILHYGNLLMLTERYSPKCIIYDLSFDFDFLAGDNHRYLSRMRLYSERDYIRDILCAVDSRERLKCLSSFYRYNGLALQIAQDRIFERYGGIKGFIPKNETMFGEAEVIEYDEDPYEHTDTLKMQYLNRFIDICLDKNIKLIFCISPIYNRRDLREFDPLITLAEQRGIPILNYGMSDAICRERTLFYDSVHMNSSGADVFSGMVAADLRRIIN